MKEWGGVSVKGKGYLELVKRAVWSCTLIVSKCSTRVPAMAVSSFSCMILRFAKGVLGGWMARFMLFGIQAGPLET